MVNCSRLYNGTHFTRLNRNILWVWQSSSHQSLGSACSFGPKHGSSPCDHLFGTYSAFTQVHSYLALQEAPDIGRQWQDSYKGQGVIEVETDATHLRRHICRLCSRTLPLWTPEILPVDHGALQQVSEKRLSSSAGWSVHSPHIILRIWRVQRLQGRKPENFQTLVPLQLDSLSTCQCCQIAECRQFRLQNQRVICQGGLKLLGAWANVRFSAAHWQRGG